ncbi:hypothetical protein B0T24DRAFT_577334 [Lasiosphaeria ovina]|uniref:Pfs domain protein n=1 Tax=Lasiosphaeria ovina TaxID=92902 RepID=A0AAE0KD23_9PEZI|nr:hypothetical protein B0T24DRAFT_577334 [Lasiosphaeria ovina]
MRLMYLVYKYRNKIAGAVIDTFSAEEEMETSVDHNTSVVSEPMSLTDKLSLWERNEGYTEAPDNVPWGDSTEVDEPDDFLELQEYRDVLLRSPAFSWLLNSALNESNLEIPDDNPKHGASLHPQKSIRDTIFLCFKTEATVLRRGTPPPTQSMVFRACWPEEFLSREYTLPPYEALDRVLVLTGTTKQPWATTCKQYIETVWPDFGPSVLDILRLLLKGENACESELFDGTCLRARVVGAAHDFDPGTGESTREPFGDKSNLEIAVKGSAYTIAEVGEILGWINTALGASRADGTIDCHSPFCKLQIAAPFTEASESPWGAMLVMELSSVISVGRIEEVSTLPGQCWTGLFGSPTLVQGYRIPRRDEPGTGMEVPLIILAQLVNTRKISIFGGRILIKGYSAILVPTRKSDGFVFWHLVSNDSADGGHISYSDLRVMDLLRVYPESLTMSDLETSRHILGWCGDVNNRTGTREANYKINWSGLRNPQPGCAFEKVSIVGGMFITGGVSCVLGKKDKAVNIRGRDDYIMRLKWISKKFVVLYDVLDRRAWMVDGVSALLHLVRGSLSHDKDDHFKSLSLYDERLLQEAPGSGAGKAASIFVLANESNISLPLVISKTHSNYTFRDRVESICDALEQMIAHQADVSTQDGVGFKIQKTIRRQLEGFDFMDIATDEDPIWPRVTTLRATGRGWVDFTRKIHAITLFGSGFGDLFHPSPTATQAQCIGCQLNVEVPKGEDFLAVCVSELRDILERRGTKTTALWRLVDDIYWHAPDKTFEPCNCKKSPPNKHDRVQVLLPSSFPKLLGRNLKIPVGVDENRRGALLFGHNRRFPLLWRDDGNPVEGEPVQEEIDELETSFHDSGIGTSLVSSSLGGGQNGESSTSSGDSPPDGPGEPSTKTRKDDGAQDPENKRRRRLGQTVDMLLSRFG